MINHINQLFIFTITNHTKNNSNFLTFIYRKNCYKLYHYKYIKYIYNIKHTIYKYTILT